MDVLGFIAVPGAVGLVVAWLGGILDYRATPVGARQRKHWWWYM